MKRTSFRMPAGAALTIKEKTRKCKACGTQFRTFSSLVYWCSPDCGSVLALRKLERQKAAAAAEDRKKTRARKEAVKTRSDHLRETQQVFNKYIRERDRLAGHPCISSGRPLDWSGNNVDAGHYRSVGSAPHLRFDERNVHAQSKQDNRYGAGRAVDYRIGLIKRIGLEAVEALEADQSTKKWTIDELRAIKAHYRAKLKALKGAQ